MRVPVTSLGLGDHTTNIPLTTLLAPRLIRREGGRATLEGVVCRDAKEASGEARCSAELENGSTGSVDEQEFFGHLAEFFPDADELVFVLQKDLDDFGIEV